MHSPGHTTNLEVTKMRTVFLLCPPWEFRLEELYRIHGWDEIVYMVLRKVATGDRINGPHHT